MWKCMEGAPAMTWLSVAQELQGCICTPCFLPQWVGKHRGPEPGPWHSSSWTPKEPQRTLQVSPCFSSGVNIHKSFFSDLWLTFIGSFISILIGGIGKGAYSPHFFWKNLPSLKPSTHLAIQITSSLSPISSWGFLQLPSLINSSWLVKQVNARKSYQDETSFHAGCWSLTGN